MIKDIKTYIKKKFPNMRINKNKINNLKKIQLKYNRLQINIA